MIRVRTVDLALLLVPSAAFGLLLTAHLALVARLATRAPRWRAPLALFLPPLAPYWGMRERFRVWCGVWVGSLLTYTLSLVLASGR